MKHLVLQKIKQGNGSSGINYLVQNNNTEKFLASFEFYRVNFESTDSVHNILTKRAYHQKEQIIFLIRLKLVQHAKINVSKRNMKVKNQFRTPLRKRNLELSFIVTKQSSLKWPTKTSAWRARPYNETYKLSLIPPNDSNH